MKKNNGHGEWSLRAVAKRAGITSGYLSRIENNLLRENTTFLPSLLRKLAKGLQHSYPDLMSAVGHIPQEVCKALPKFIPIPIYGAIPFNSIRPLKEIPDEDHLIVDWKVLEGSVSTPEDLIALKADGNCLKDIGYSDGDYVIVTKSRKEEINTGDAVFFRLFNKETRKNEYTCKLFSIDRHGMYIFQTANKDLNEPPIILNPKGQDYELIGKIITGIKRHGI